MGNSNRKLSQIRMVQSQIINEQRQQTPQHKNLISTQNKENIRDKLRNSPMVQSQIANDSTPQNTTRQYHEPFQSNLFNNAAMAESKVYQHGANGSIIQQSLINSLCKSSLISKQEKQSRQGNSTIEGNKTQTSTPSKQSCLPVSPSSLSASISTSVSSATNTTALNNKKQNVNIKLCYKVTQKSPGITVYKIQGNSPQQPL